MKVLIVTALLLLPGYLFAQQKLTASEANKHIGETATVCGSVASTNYAARTRGRPTFLNLDRAYPNQIFTVVIWGENRDKFLTPPERAFRDKNICATGEIKSYRGGPEIIVTDTSQIQIEKK